MGDKRKPKAPKADVEVRTKADAEVAKGEADVERWRFNRDVFGEDFAAAEELAWDMRLGDW